MSWFHFFTISIAIHAGIFALAYFMVPDVPAFQFFATEQEHERRIIAFQEAIISELSIDTETREEAVSADEDPFEMETAEIVQPEMHLELPAPREDIPVQKTVSTENVSQETVSPKPIELKVDQTAELTDKTSDSMQETAETGINQAESDETSTNSMANDGKGNAAPAQNTVKTNPEGKTGNETAQGTGNGAKSSATDETSLWKAYTQTLSNHFKQRKHYPDMAKRLRLTGTVWIMVEISREGEVLSAEIAQSSGIDMLDEAALDAAKKSGPVPRFPDGVTASTKKVRIPYHYQISTRIPKG